MTVYRFVALGTIEQHKILRQHYKTHLSKMVVDGTKEAQVFDGIEGNKDSKGAIFGTANQLQYRPSLPDNLTQMMVRKNNLQFGVVEVDLNNPQTPRDDWDLSGQVSDNDDEAKVEDRITAPRPKAKTTRRKGNKPNEKSTKRKPQPKTKRNAKFVREFNELKQHAAFVAADLQDEITASQKLDGEISEEEFAPFTSNTERPRPAKRRKRTRKTTLRLA